MARRTLSAAIFLAVAVLSVTLRSDDPVSSAVTFNREVIRIFQRKCLQCHAPGAVSMPLGTYRDARAWSRAIREELVEQRMPPWGAAAGFTPLAGELALTSREMTMLLTWVDGGVPRGQDRDLPKGGPPQPPAPPPDAILQLPAQHIPAEQDLVVRRVTIDSGFSTSRRLRRIEIVPGNRRVLRGAFVFVQSSVAVVAGPQWVGAWTPWRDTFTPPEAAAFVVPRGAKLVAELHYRGRDVDEEDRTSIGLSYGPPGEAVVGQLTIDASAPPGAAHGIVRGTSTVNDDTRVWAIVPQITAIAAADDEDGRAGSLEVTARRPDGSVDVLLWIPAYRRDWPIPYLLREPVLLPAGTRISMTAKGIAPASDRIGVALSTYR